MATTEGPHIWAMDGPSLKCTACGLSLLHTKTTAPSQTAARPHVQPTPRLCPRGCMLRMTCSLQSSMWRPLFHYLPGPRAGGTSADILPLLQALGKQACKKAARAKHHFCHAVWEPAGKAMGRPAEAAGHSANAAVEEACSLIVMRFTVI